ncbi:hypothetical protein PM10SUCC1_30620 [Propionigenium maris DSM 9537]|uniref:Uncharacterized protein n=1 Tax=Propionigenium maris DSM 9537 TaxID=1123000 RepID=A0A9W6GLZ7_9FUSO|nr:hypothetical protein [Propionigenium maris]GLI57548.1 hypothetical protein PM10SUCC1_30620 [Propionigenium maris DSM 9537]
MKYIKLNLNEKYINREREIIEDYLLKLSVIVFLAGMMIILKNYHRDSFFYATRISEIRKAGEEQRLEVTGINEEIGEILRKQRETREEIEGSKEIIQLVHDVGMYQVTEIMNKLEAITRSSSFYLTEFSIRGEEVSVYIQNPRVDLIRVISEFEPYFRRVVITEQSDERLTLRLSDINEP